MAPRDDRSNRVEVELKLLRDKNLEMLAGIFDKFTKQLEDLSAQGAFATPGAAAAGGVSPTASVAGTRGEGPTSEQLRTRAIGGLAVAAAGGGGGIGGGITA